MKVIDADKAILGRLASEVARELMKGEKVVVVNAEKAIISGNPDDIYERYKQRVDRADIANPRKGPKFPRRPDMLVKRTIKGMLPKTNKGKQMLRNLKVYMMIPKEYEGKSEKIGIRVPKKGGYITIKELSTRLGWIPHNRR